MSMMDDMNPSVGVVTHLHGAKVQPDSDGWPLEPLSFAGNPYPPEFHEQRTYTYPNDQRAEMLWFHDHGMDNTAPQVYAGLAGVYFIRDDSDAEIFDLIDSSNQANENRRVNLKREIPLVIQDRVVDCDFWHLNYLAGRPIVNTLGIGDSLISQDFDRPEFLGETIFVNGRPWPHHDVDLQIYRLRILNGSNARTYALALIDPAPWSADAAPAKPKVWHSDLLTVIGNDGGLYPKSQTLNPTDYILLAPGERLDLLLDLTGLNPKETPKLRLVNLAVSTIANVDWPEAIFQTESAIQIPGNSQPVASSILQPKPTDEFDRKLLASLSAIKQANIMQFCIKTGKAGTTLNIPTLDAILQKYADEEGFHWNAESNQLESIPSDAPIAKNRLVLLMNDTSGFKTTHNPLTGGPWKDTQMWEMATPSGRDAGFTLPFAIDLDSSNPKAGDPFASGVNYKVARSTFFDMDPATFQPISDSQRHYAKLQETTIKPKAGTYERWYIANIGNQQPLTAGVSKDPASAPNVPDMHPFHIHLVDFVVLRRFAINPITNQFVSVSHDNTFNTQIRHDTVRIQSNELLELLVYFPTRGDADEGKDYQGKYPFHCHLVEHEDMGMMLHFAVEA